MATIYKSVDKPNIVYVETGMGRGVCLIECIHPENYVPLADTPES